MKRKLFLMGALALIVAGGILLSCQKEELMNTEDGVMLKNGVVCDCVNNPTIDSHKTTLNNNDNYADVEVWNDNTNFYIKVTANDNKEIEGIHLSYPFSYTVDNAKNCNFTINYNTIFNNDGTPFNSHTFILDLPDAWVGCDQVGFALKITGIDGNPVFLKGADATETFEYTQGQDIKNQQCTNVPAPVNYELKETCVCNESFSYEIIDGADVTAIFSYKSDITIMDAEVKLTCPHISVALNDEGKFEGNDGKFYDVNNNGNVTVLTWTGELTECIEQTFEVTLIPDCEQNKSGKVNVWTDFKVNEVSKKGLTLPPNPDCETITIDEKEVEVCTWPIIKYTCPE